MRAASAKQAHRQSLARRTAEKDRTARSEPQKDVAYLFPEDFFRKLYVRSHNFPCACTTYGKEF